MKKLLFTLLTLGLIYGCAQPSAPAEDPAADLQKALAGYSGACADKYFTETRTEIANVFAQRTAGNATEADAAYSRARSYYETALPNYEKAKAALDAANAQIADQRSRLDNLRSAGTASVPAQYTKTEADVTALQASASTKLAACDVEGAQSDLDKAESSLRALESALGKASAAPSKTETYVVVRGDCLWKIAANKYANPYFWPLIYWTNKSIIKDPDLIYPNQRFEIDYGYNDQGKAEADKFAKTRGPWSLYDNK